MRGAPHYTLRYLDPSTDKCLLTYYGPLDDNASPTRGCTAKLTYPCGESHTGTIKLSPNLLPCIDTLVYGQKKDETSDESDFLTRLSLTNESFFPPFYPLCYMTLNFKLRNKLYSLKGLHYISPRFLVPVQYVTLKVDGRVGEFKLTVYNAQEAKYMMEIEDKKDQADNMDSDYIEFKPMSPSIFLDLKNLIIPMLSTSFLCPRHPNFNSLTNFEAFHATVAALDKFCHLNK